MEFNEAKIRALELCEIINNASIQYYQQNNPSMSDYDFDMLLKELEGLEEAFPELSSADSPTRRVGGTSDNTFEKVRHDIQMGSLQDVFSIDELKAFDERVRSELQAPEYVVEPKIDGLSVSLEYVNGVFSRGSTRGDGFIGEDVSANLRTIRSIPLKLKTPLPFLEVRGEVYMPRKAFESLVEEQLLNEEAPFKNPRNAAAGSLRQKNSKTTAKRKLDIFIFNIQQIQGKAISTHSDGLDFLKSEGFPVSPSYKQFNGIDDIITEIDRIGTERYSFGFDIDGAVVKVNSLEDREFLGATSKFPKWAAAFKYPPEEKESTLTAIEINVGRTGALTPTAVFEPITLAGTTVSRAVLHNQDFIDEKDIRIGDRVVIRKAGDIIPEVLCSLSHAENSVKFEIPSICPSCGSKTVREEGQSAMRCVNPECPSAVFRSIIHFASRNAMNIDGLGPAIVQALIDSENIKTVADLYTLDKEKLLELERFGEKSVDNLLLAIEKSKENQLSRLIFGIGIRNIGQKAAELICQKYPDIDLLKSVSAEKLMEIDGIGNIIAESMVDFFAVGSNIELIQKLIGCGVGMTETVKESQGNLTGKTFVITGTLTDMSRDEAAEMIKQNGGRVSASVSKKTSYLLAGDNAGSKLDKAGELGVTILSLDDLRSLIDDE